MILVRNAFKPLSLYIVQKLNIFYTTLESVLEQAAPLREVVVKGDHKLWFVLDLLELIKARHLPYKKFKFTNNTKDNNTK